jgi:hypothetical protein
LLLSCRGLRSPHGAETTCGSPEAFAGYVFVELGDENWSEVAHVSDVDHILMAGGAPAKELAPLIWRTPQVRYMNSRSVGMRTADFADNANAVVVDRVRVADCLHAECIGGKQRQVTASKKEGAPRR